MKRLTLGSVLAWALVFAFVLPDVAASKTALPTSLKALAIHAAQREMGAFCAGNRAGFVAAFASKALILDDTAPFVFHGSAGVGRWYDANRPGLADVTITPGKPIEADVSPANARVYLVLPITIAGDGRKGGAFKATAYWTGVTQTDAGGTRILALTITPAP